MDQPTYSPVPGPTHFGMYNNLAALCSNHFGPLLLPIHCSDSIRSTKPSQAQIWSDLIYN
jgi:hypothetical protein